MIRIAVLFSAALILAAGATAQPDRGPGDRAPAAVTTDKAPQAIGPYSQAIRAGRTLYCSGQVAINPATQKMEATTIEAQTKQALENLKAVLEAAGADLKSVVKTTVYLKDMNNFAKMNEVYATYFTAPFPARATVEVARLPKDAIVEIECTAVVQGR